MRWYLKALLGSKVPQADLDLHSSWRHPHMKPNTHMGLVFMSLLLDVADTGAKNSDFWRDSSPVHTWQGRPPETGAQLSTAAAH